MDKYNYNNLAQLIDVKVLLRDKQGNEAELVIAEVYRGKMDGDEWEAFSVIYSGKAGFFIPQGTYVFIHEKFGEKELFLTPKSETEYETVITRKKEEKISRREQTVS